MTLVVQVPVEEILRLVDRGGRASELEIEVTGLRAERDALRTVLSEVLNEHKPAQTHDAWVRVDLLSRRGEGRLEKEGVP